MQPQIVKKVEMNRTTVLVEGSSNGVQHHERTACSICRKNRPCNCGDILDEESDINQASKFKNENYNKILNEIFDVSPKEVLGYTTKTLLLKKVPQVKVQSVVRPPISSNYLNCHHQHSYSQRETFIVVDRVPQLHLETCGDHYIDDSAKSSDLLGSLLKQHSQWRPTNHTETGIASTASVTSQAALEEKPEQNTDIVRMISKTLSVCNVSENLEENCTAAKGDLHSDQARNSQTLTGFYEMKGSSAGSFTASSVSHVSVATTLSGNSPGVGSSVSASSGVNHSRFIGLAANAGNKSSKLLGGGNVPSVAGAQAGMVLMMVYGNREECARVGCGPRWVHRSQIQDNDIPSSKMSKMMDKDGTLDISFDEWRDYLLFHPSANLHDIIHYWRHATSLDIGEDLSVPDDFSPEEWVSGKWWRHLVAGGVAGMVSRTCTAPLDRLKVFLQVHGATKYRSLRDCFKYMIDEGGVKSLWRGNGVNVIKIAPESALKFAAYEQAKGFIMRNFGDPDRELRIEERFAAGSFAGAFSQSVIYPMEVLKTRLAIRKSGQYRGIADAATQIFRTEGIRSFYRGYIPNLLGIIPYAGIDLAVYETLKKRYAQMRPGDKDPSVLVIIGCGALSSSCGQIASYPLALIRTRLQAQVMSKDRVPHPDQPTTSIGLFKQIIKKEGPLGLYRGIAPNFMKVAPAVSISYVVYEKFREALGVRMT